ncbi:MAG: hypothetical protein R2741_14660 [Methanolobus sp.]
MKILEIMQLERKEDIIGFDIVASIVDENMKKLFQMFFKESGSF